MPSAVRRAALNNAASTSNSGGPVSPASASGNAEEDLLKGLGLDISVLAPMKVRPESKRSNAGKARKALDKKTLFALEQSFKNLLDGNDDAGRFFPIVHTNRDWTNEVQRTITHWASDQRAAGVMVITGLKKDEVPKDYQGTMYQVTQTKHPQSPNSKSPKPDDADKVILYVIGVEPVEQEAEESTAEELVAA